MTISSPSGLIVVIGSLGVGTSNLFITPGYEFRVIDGLLTNFHLPKSTLLSLIIAFAGKNL